jgi:hypothetical protein
VGASIFYESASELATISNTFQVGGTVTDPSTVSLTITTPSQVATVYTFAAGQITKTSTGVYTKDIACSEDGDWHALWEGTGTASDADAGTTWTVFETTLGKLYPTVAALKSRMGIKPTDVVDDYEIHHACFTASRSIENVCERHFWRTPAGTVRTFVPCDQYQLRLPEFNDLVLVATLKTDGSGDGTFETTWAAADYQLLPHNPSAAPEPKPYTKVKAVGAQTFPVPWTRLARDDRVEITGVFGWPSIPLGVKWASLTLAEEIFAAKDARFGVAGFGEFGAVRVRENPLIGRLLLPYMRNPIKVA